ncbi:PQQ-binding-like beta-propeller repeat protein [Tuwongella immobilis]|uniref:Pyrrolo-quinoline quinone repeat domain-containing protein n=1 Tax=Tuwongella immobilis TaxID=692036 RepID=A0A6C2YTI7_9BACT|nr:PQQ-binding-like beta-propeller repeat protein [Tuwongella immobilis]VIP04657.1 Pyrrolo-quinoline quinone OS=Chthoniobacter flavus Ellin428 GN=CfE428DRAFT_4660 PE=4 SV=1: PQQ_2 [Tuwongella immobilis]VTS06675.1 Pyrrolo-quinoline quinone OS=Chthoniobacter flavus Ellin428 GN=CfE428DRAFT_4660 PE=4 SV=1: PQQ_2 [Tuwongella immobilis]
MKLRWLPLLGMATVLMPTLALAADWPQWRGPNRDGKSSETGLNPSLSEPKLLWTATGLGNSYSGPAIVGDRIYSMGADKTGNVEYLFCLDATNGKELWRTVFAKFVDNNWGGGPRGNPTVDGDRVYGLGAGGDLVCLNTKDGSKVWAVNFPKDLGGKMMSSWNFSESVLIDGDRVICTPGGSKGTLAALNKMTGEVIWRSTGLTDPAAYASIQAHELGGIKQYITMTNKGVVGVKADDGKLLWQSPLAKNPTAVIPTPVIKGNLVFVTSGYGAGCGLVKLTPDGKGGITAEDVYDNKDMSNHHGGVILIDDHVYGHSDRKGWTCMELETGKVVWAENKKQDKGSIVYADGHFWLYGEGSHALVTIKATTEGFQEVGRMKLPKETTIRARAGRTWTHPVIANGKLYLRDQDLLFCFDVSK